MGFYMDPEKPKRPIKDIRAEDAFWDALEELEEMTPKREAEMIAGAVKRNYLYRRFGKRHKEWR